MLTVNALRNSLLTVVFVICLIITTIVPNASALDLTVKPNPLVYSHPTGYSGPSSTRICGDHICDATEDTKKLLLSMLGQNFTNNTIKQNQTEKNPNPPKESTIQLLPVMVANNYYTMAQSGILEIHPPGVLANSSQSIEKSPVVNLVTNVKNGTLELHHDGGFIYIPDVNFYGVDTFKYVVTDSGINNFGNVTITVENLAPIAQNDFYMLTENSTLSVGEAGILANDSSSNGKTLNAKIISNVVNGQLNLYQNGSFAYTPNPNFYGSDSFVYKASDGTVSGNNATVLLLVKPILAPNTQITDLINQIQILSSKVTNLENEILDLKSQYAILENNVHQLETDTSNTTDTKAH